MKEVWVIKCRFQREKGSAVEEGLAFGHKPGVYDIDFILDSDLVRLKRQPHIYNLDHNSGFICLSGGVIFKFKE